MPLRSTRLLILLSALLAGPALAQPSPQLPALGESAPITGGGLGRVALPITALPARHNSGSPLNPSGPTLFDDDGPLPGLENGLPSGLVGIGVLDGAGSGNGQLIGISALGGSNSGQSSDGLGVGADEAARQPTSQRGRSATPATCGRAQYPICS